MIFNLLSLANVLAGLLLFYCSLRYYRQWRGLKPWVWIKLLYALLGAYWAAVYLVVLLAPQGAVEMASFGQTWLRPANTLTLAAMAAGAWMGMRR